MTYRTSRRRALQLGLAASLAAPAIARAQQGWPAGPITCINVWAHDATRAAARTDADPSPRSRT